MLLGIKNFFVRFWPFCVFQNKINKLYDEQADLNNKMTVLQNDEKRMKNENLQLRILTNALQNKYEKLESKYTKMHFFSNKWNNENFTDFSNKKYDFSKLSDQTSFLTKQNADEIQQVCVSIPIELIFTESVEFAIAKCEFATDTWKKEKLLWENIPLVALKPHRQLFEFFMNGTSLPLHYLHWYRNIFETRDITPPPI